MSEQSISLTTSPVEEVVARMPVDTGDSLTIGGFNYPVLMLSSANIDEPIGQSNELAQEILVVPGLTEERYRAVLLHEALHVMLHHYGVFSPPLPREEEEAVVSRLEAALLQFIADNHTFVYELTRSLQEQVVDGYGGNYVNNKK